MPDIEESPRISGLLLANLQAHSDERGRLVEIFRKEWFPQRSWQAIQSNRSESAAGILRGLHFHHRQVDYWHVISGTIRVGIADLRKSSATRGATEIIDLSAKDNRGLFIPAGVAHGFYAITRATLIYIVDNYYDGKDEYGLAWNDPDINLEWSVADPILSPRDLANPRLKEIPASELPP